MLKTKAQIKRTYNNITRKYGGYRRKPWPILKEFLNKVDDDLLDIGSANCCYCKDILNRGYKYYGVDFSEELLKLAPEGVIKIKADCCKIPLKRKFRYIMAIALLHHLPTEKDRLAFLREVKRLLAKDGEALITVWYSKEKGDRIVKWGTFFKRYYHFFSKKELEDLLKKASFNKFEIIKHKDKLKTNFFIKIKG